jgi:transcription elongation factor/antiterminator RfaH
MTQAPLSPSRQRWYLVNTQTGRERLAMDHLERQDYRVFTPWTRKTVRHARKINTVRAAFFPGYVFVALDMSRQRWRPIDGTVGVLRIVKAGVAPVAAPDGLVETFIAAGDEEGYVSFGADLAVGDGVRIMAGPFADRLAVVEALPGPDRVRVLLEFMNQGVRVELDARDVTTSRDAHPHHRDTLVTSL